METRIFYFFHKRIVALNLKKTRSAEYFRHDIFYNLDAAVVRGRGPPAKCAYKPVVSEHGEVFDVFKFPIPRASKPVPQVGSKDLRSLKKDDRLSVVRCLISVAGEGGGEPVCQLYCVFLAGCHEAAHFSIVMLQIGTDYCVCFSWYQPYFVKGAFQVNFKIDLCELNEALPL